MFGKHWIAALALGLALALSSIGPGQAQNENGRPQSPDAETAEDGSSAPPAFPVRIIQPESEHQASQRIEEEARARQERDILAQEGMEAAAVRTAKLAFWQTVFAGVGTIALIVTLLLMWGANSAATKAANAAVDQVEAMKRPHLRVRHERLKNGGAEIAIENSGNAIADIVHREFIVHFADSRPIPRHWTFDSPTNSFPHTELPPGGFKYWTAPVPEATGKAVARVMGGIIYRKKGDERTYRTFFCREYYSARGRFIAIDPDPEYERED